MLLFVFCQRCLAARPLEKCRSVSAQSEITIAILNIFPSASASSRYASRTSSVSGPIVALSKESRTLLVTATIRRQEHSHHTRRTRPATFRTTGNCISFQIRDTKSGYFRLTHAPCSQAPALTMAAHLPFNRCRPFAYKQRLIPG